MKGYSLARVTHLDLESEVMNEILRPGSGEYVPLKVEEGTLRITLREPRYVKSLGIMVREIRVVCDELAKALGEGVRSWGFLGGKWGGVFLGFRKELLEGLERLACAKGVKPRGGSSAYAPPP